MKHGIASDEMIDILACWPQEAHVFCTRAWMSVCLLGFVCMCVCVHTSVCMYVRSLFVLNNPRGLGSPSGFPTACATMRGCGAGVQALRPSASNGSAWVRRAGPIPVLLLAYPSSD